MTTRRDGVTESLRRRIVAGIHLGTLHAGDRLPSLREAAAELAADQRVILAAYTQLAREGLVRLRPRSGVFVASPPVPEENRLPEVAASLVDVFLKGLSHGVAPEEVWRQARACLATARVRVACLECNDDQLYALCQQVRRDYGFDAMSVDCDAIAGGRPLPRKLRQVDLVVTTRFHVAQAERLGRRLRRPVVVATLDPVFINEIRRLLATGSVWWICTDPRFAAKLPRMFPHGSIRPVTLGRRPPRDIPPEEPVYATRRAAERLPKDWHGGRFVTVPRAFSIDTARALIVFLLRRNLLEARAREPRRPGRR